MMTVARSSHGHHSRHRAAWAAAVLLATVSALGLAGTQAGRDLIGWLLVPIERHHHVHWDAPDGSAWTQSRGEGDPYTPEEANAVAEELGEIYQIQQAGGGRLVYLLENPEYTAYGIGYTLSNGETSVVGSGRPSDKQAENMRIAEIMALRDAGAGELLLSEWSSIGLGKYTIRFTLSDGQTIDLCTYYPPGPREEREAIFAETRRLKDELRFTVEDPRSTDGGWVFGLLRYTLSDGRVVGISEQVPAEAITADGALVAVPKGDPSVGGVGDDEQARRLKEAEQIRQAGGGRLLALLEGPHGSISQTIYVTEYELSDGQTFTVASSGKPRGKQAENMRIDEVEQLRDAGAGTVISQREPGVGLGMYTIRFTLADGHTVDLETEYPPATRQERQAIFAETRRLKKELRFSVHRPTLQADGRIPATLGYELADGRVVGIREQVPRELISADGKYLVLPHSGQTVEIERASDEDE